MATLKDIRKRIGSVKNTQKITKAMKMVAAAKMRRAQNALMQSRPYTHHLEKILGRLAVRLNEEVSPFLKPHQPELPAVLLVLTSDRGLCGGFNSNLLRRVQYFLEVDSKKHARVDVQVIGRRGRDFLRTRKVPLQKEITGVSGQFSFANALEMANEVLESYRNGEIGTFYIAYNGFKSAISQEIRIKQVFPLSLDRSDIEESLAMIIAEPSAPELFDQLLPRAIASEIYLSMLESQTSELGARMSAMENATNNAKEMISLLTLQYNRARQAAITKELMDIVNGAEALK